MALEEFFDYKNKLIGDLLTNKKIVSLLNDNNGDVERVEDLVYTQVFPYDYIPDTIEHGQTFICCEVDIQSVVNKTYLSPIIYIWVFTHDSKVLLPEGGLRVDRLVSEIESTINGSRKYGLGVLELKSAKRFIPINTYRGKVMIFEAKDFNRLSPSNFAAPDNRKSQ